VGIKGEEIGFEVVLVGGVGQVGLVGQIRRVGFVGCRAGLGVGMMWSGGDKRCVGLKVGVVRKRGKNFLDVVARISYFYVVARFL